MSLSKNVAEGSGRSALRGRRLSRRPFLLPLAHHASSYRRTVFLVDSASSDSVPSELTLGHLPTKRPACMCLWTAGGLNASHGREEARRSAASLRWARSPTRSRCPRPGRLCCRRAPRASRPRPCRGGSDRSTSACTTGGPQARQGSRSSGRCPGSRSWGAGKSVVASILEAHVWVTTVNLPARCGVKPRRAPRATSWVAPVALHVAAPPMVKRAEPPRSYTSQ